MDLRFLRREPSEDAAQSQRVLAKPGAHQIVAAGRDGQRRVEPNLATLRAILWLVIEGGAAGATLWALGATLAAAAQGLDPLVVRRTFLLSWGGYMAGILAVAPIFLSWRRRGDWLLDARSAAHLAAAVATCALAAYLIFLSPLMENKRGWFLFPALVWT